MHPYILLMKLLRSLIILLISGLFLLSCEEDFEINAPYKNITVVYSLLDLGDDTSYVRINKAFLGEGDVFEMVEIADSSTYRSDLNAVIEEWAGNNFVRSFDLDTITIDNKKDGLFYNPYQLLYYTVAQLQPDKEYRIRVIVAGDTLTGRTPMVNDFGFYKPGTSSIYLKKGNSTNIEWSSALNGKRYEVVFRFNYRELMYGSTDTIYRYMDWVQQVQKSPTTDKGKTMSIVLSNDAFYSLMLDRVPYKDAAVEANVSERFTTSFEIIISVGAEQLNTYMEVNEPSNSIVQDKPDYTNITHGIGIFSSRFRKVVPKKVHENTVVEIQNLPVDLRFVR